MVYTPQLNSLRKGGDFQLARMKKPLIHKYFDKNKETEKKFTGVKKKKSARYDMGQ